MSFWTNFAWRAAVMTAGFCTPVLGQQAAESTFPFDPWQARTLGMGSAGAALSGLEFVTINPAALPNSSAFSATRMAVGFGARDLSAEAAITGSWGALGLQFRNRDWGEVAADLALPDLTVREQSFSAGYGSQLSAGRAAFGVSVAYLLGNYLGNRTSGWSFDLGVRASLGHGLAVGVSTLRAAGKIDDAVLPRRLRAGVSWTNPFGRFRTTSAADVAIPISGAASARPDLFAGNELEYRHDLFSVAARGGVRLIRTSDARDPTSVDWTIGGSLAISKFGVHAARSINGSVFDNTSISLSYRW